MKIPFDIKYRPQIESGEYKVETRDGRSVEIVKWDFRSRHGKTPILAIIHGDYDYNHTYSDDGYSIFVSDKLFIVAPEEEKLTPFEVEVKSWMGVAEDIVIDDSWVKTCAKALLSLAREQFIKDGYVIEKKIFHDAVKKVDPEVMKEVSENMDMQIALHTEYEKGKEDVLKDLPRWRIWWDGACGGGEYPIALVKNSDGSYKLTCCLGIDGEKYIMLSDLEKLPGFKED